MPAYSVNWLRRVVKAVGFLVLLSVSVWALLALYFDGNQSPAPVPLAIIYLAGLAVVAYKVKNRHHAALLCVLGFCLVLVWWLRLQPTKDRQWQADVARTAFAENSRDRVTIHNVRNFEYRTETDFTPRWEIRTVELSKIRAFDLFLTTLGVPGIAHPIVSFEFGDGQHIAFSIETRKAVGSDYSLIRGFFRQYELVYIVSDERDVVRLRTNYRKGEEVFLYRLKATPDQCRRIFMAYVDHVNRLNAHAEWYNALTQNCTTNIRTDVGTANDGKLINWDYRILLNASLDRALYEKGYLDSTLPFPELKRRAFINSIAKNSDQDAGFSRRIRNQSKPSTLQ